MYSNWKTLIYTFFMPKITICADLRVNLCISLTKRGLISKQGLTLERGSVNWSFSQIHGISKFPNLMKITYIFPIKKGRGSFEKSQQYHWLSNKKNLGYVQQLQTIYPHSAWYLQHNI